MDASWRIQRFEVIDHLGSGGMGSVYRARDPQLERDVAIKLLLTTNAPSQLSFKETIDLRGDEVPPGAIDLMREARMMARLSHPNVLPVYEVGLSGGAVFLVMEHIDGTDLSSWLAVTRSTAEILDVFWQAAQGVLAAHQRGVVHRDIKPANILIGGDGRVRVADFGLSQLVDRSSRAMVQVAVAGGTPHFMAPELWLGQPASPPSDVFALCVALLDALGAGDPATRERALRERGVRPRLRETLVRGVAVDPASRPDVGQLARAIADHARRPWRAWRTWAAAAVATGAAAVGIALALPGAGTSAPRAAPPASTCEVDREELAAVWSPARRSQLRAHLTGAEKFPAAAADSVLAELDRQKREIEEQLLAACEAERAGEITSAQRGMRASCLERRGFELAGTLEFLSAASPSPTTARDAVGALKAPGECLEMTAPPIAGDRAAVEKLWRRYPRTREYAVPERIEQMLAELTAIEAQAVAIGEVELAAYAARWQQSSYRFTDRLDRADQALQRAHRIAIEHHMSSFAARVLVDRTSIAYVRGDAASARSYGELARDIADRPTTQPATRAAVYCALGRAALTRDDMEEAVRQLQHSLELLRSSKTNVPSTELACRFSLFEALTSTPPPGSPDPLELARETADYARRELGERDLNYGQALTQVARALFDRGDRIAGIDQHRKALEIIRASAPANSSPVTVARARLAHYLYAAGELVVAGKELEELLADIQTNESVRSQRPTLASLYALITFELGRTERGHALALQALEDAIAVLGQDHDHTLQLRAQVASMEIEMRSTRSAARHLDALDRGLASRPDAHRPDLTRLRSALRAELAIQQGRPRAAESAMRAALREKGSDDRVALVYQILGYSLVARGKQAEARRTLERALSHARKASWRADKIAAIEAKLAVAEAGLGRRSDARARARRVRRALAGTGQLIARADIEQVLARRRR
jgi:eukaryotic-like serine/threonine-protein kinase